MTSRELKSAYPFTHQAIWPTVLTTTVMMQLPVTLNGGMMMNSWYDLASLEKIDDKEDVENLHASAE